MIRPSTLRLILCTFPLLLGITSVAQERNRGTFVVESWKSGPRQIKEQRLAIELSAKKINYATMVRDASGKERYKLVISHYPLRRGGANHNFWDITLFDELGKYPNDNLLRAEGPGVGDNFPKEDFIAVLYPVEQPNIYKDVNSHFPMSAKRVIKVESFYVIIRVADYKFSSRNPKQLDSLNVQIEFTNKYEDGIESRQAKKF